MKPAMQVVLMRKQTQLLTGSHTANRATSSGLGEGEELYYIGQGDYEAR